MQRLHPYLCAFDQAEIINPGEQIGKTKLPLIHARGKLPYLPDQGAPVIIHQL